MIAERLTAQLLAGPPAGDPTAVAERLLAIQAQDARGARLAVRARTTGLSAADVDRELTERRSLVITWLNRGTLHIVGSEDYWWLQALTTPPVFTGNVWGAQTRFHAARLYSWTSPPRRSRRSTPAAGGRARRSFRAGGSGGARFSARCGLWLL